MFYKKDAILILIFFIGTTQKKYKMTLILHKNKNNKIKIKNNNKIEKKEWL